LVPADDPESIPFAYAKKDHFEKNPQRAQSNNSLVFYQKPSKETLYSFFQIMKEGGGSEPGIINAQTALKRAPWFKGVNPCAEILLGSKSFCNLVEINLAAFPGPVGYSRLCKAVRLIARANYRQTCVDLRDGVLQSAWHENNEYLRLTGVGLTGIVRWEHKDDAERLKALKSIAGKAANEMADELKLPRSKSVTTVKPSGTLSKIMDTTEGIHKPLGKYIFNNVRFSTHDPIVAKLERSGYRVFPDPYSGDAVLVTFPVAWEDVEFETVTTDDGRVIEVNQETALAQLERYKLYMQNYVSHNASITISYSPEEVPTIVDWLDYNWDVFVGVSFLYRNDPTKTAKDLGYPYLPQEVVTQEEYEDYVSTLKTVRLDMSEIEFEEIIEDDCLTGACPIR
jgi:ribonucleoside-triphosphate reductase